MTRFITLLMVSILGLAVLLVQSSPALAKKEGRLNEYCFHGIITQAQMPDDQFSEINLYGEGKDFRWPGGVNGDPNDRIRKFFIPLTTPDMIESTSVNLRDYYLLFKTFCGAKVIGIEAYDGDHLIDSWKTSLSGDYSSKIERGGNDFHGRLYDLISGLNMVIDVSTTDATIDCEDGLPGILFIGAGAGYYREW